MQQQDTFASRLTKLMKERGESHAEIGRVVGVSGQAVGKWAKGGNIEYDNLQSLAQHFDVNWIWLRYGDDAMTAFSERRTGSKARRNMIQGIMENEERLRLALDAAHIGTWDLDLVGDQLVLSAEAQQLLALDPKQLRGTSGDLLSGVAEAERAQLERVLEQALSGELDRFDLTLTTAQGRMRQRGKVVKDDVGRPVRIVAVVTGVHGD
jgi:PAS domain-containing protein